MDACGNFEPSNIQQEERCVSVVGIYDKVEGIYEKLHYTFCCQKNCFLPGNFIEMTSQSAPGSQLQVREPGAGTRFDLNLELEGLVHK